MRKTNLLAISFALVALTLMFTGCGGGGSSSDRAAGVVGTWKSQDGSTRLEFPNSSGCNGKWKGTAASGTCVVNEGTINLKIQLDSGGSLNLSGTISGDQMQLVEGTTQTFTIFKEAAPEPTPAPTPEPKDNSTNISGTWTLAISEEYDSDGTVESTEYFTMTISQSGSSLSLTIGSKYRGTGSVNGDKISFSLQNLNQPETDSFSGTINSSARSISGTYNGTETEDYKTEYESGRWTASKK